MIKQNDKKNNQNIRLYGCNFISLLAGVEQKTGYNFTHKEVENIYQISLKNGWIRANCHTLEPHKVACEGLRTAGVEHRCVQIGYYDFFDKLWKNWKNQAIKEVNDDDFFAIKHYRSNFETGHFCLADVKMQETFDPWDESIDPPLGKQNCDRAYLYKFV